jgi:hypothetical protein
VISPEDAILIINGWLDNKSELLLSASMINFSVYSKCRVVSIDEGKVTLWSVNDGAAAFSFSIDSPYLDLAYSELREFKGKPGLEDVPEEMLLKSALILTLALNKLDATAPLSLTVEQVILSEL